MNVFNFDTVGNAHTKPQRRRRFTQTSYLNWQGWRIGVDSSLARKLVKWPGEILDGNRHSSQ
jgi:hypothetical protein